MALHGPHHLALKYTTTSLSPESERALSYSDCGRKKIIDNKLTFQFVINVNEKFHILHTCTCRKNILNRFQFSYVYQIISHFPLPSKLCIHLAPLLYRPYALTSRLHNNDAMLGVKTCRAARTCCAGRAHWRSASQSVPGPARRYGMQGLAHWLHAWRWRTWQCHVWPPTRVGALLWHHMHKVYSLFPLSTLCFLFPLHPSLLHTH